MRQPPDAARIQQQMMPGVITADGFLGNDRRALSEILDADDAAVNRLGLTHAEIAAALQNLRRIGREALGLPAAASPHLEVRVESTRGVLPCPFGERGVHGKSVTVIHNRRLGESLTVSDLQLHLIDRHGFYQGRGSRHRLDPERIARVLELI